jgi:hypothetical protein
MPKTKDIKLTPKAKELLLNIQGGAYLMWSYKAKCYLRFCGKGFTVCIRSEPADRLIDMQLVNYVGDGRHEGERVAKYSLSDLGKSIEL